MSTTTAPLDTATPPTATDEGGGGKKKKLILIVVLVLALGGAGYWFKLRPSGEESAPVAGEVMPLDPMQVNLKDGHYLRIGLALQLTEGAHKADGSKALDAAIELFSGRSVGELGKPGDRAKLKKELEHALEEAYHGEVMGVYYTEFVTQ